MVLPTPSCDKKKLSRIDALLIVAKSQSRANKNHKRRETRIYFCKDCGAWHTTSLKNF